MSKKSSALAPVTALSRIEAPAGATVHHVPVAPHLAPKPKFAAPKFGAKAVTSRAEPTEDAPLMLGQDSIAAFVKDGMLVLQMPIDPEHIAMCEALTDRKTGLPTGRRLIASLGGNFGGEALGFRGLNLRVSLTGKA